MTWVRTNDGDNKANMEAMDNKSPSTSICDSRAEEKVEDVENVKDEVE